MNIVLWALCAALVGFLVYVAAKPAFSTVSRSAVLPASAETIFPHINSLKNWQDWSPWAQLDPNAKATFSGPETGPGAQFSWQGNNQVGAGTMTIAESEPSKRIKIKLDFLKPMASSSFAEFTLQPEGAGTRVTWTMSGERPFGARLMCTLFNADKMVGGMFEKGLANLASVSSKT
jgi:Polyketide cyclase / dehydrase and lipid transport